MAPTTAPPEVRGVERPHRTLVAPRPRPDPPPPERTPMSASGVLRAALVALTVGGLLCSHTLVSVAERQPFGVVRDVTLPAARAIDRVSNLLSLNRPADLADEWLHHKDEGGGGFVFDPPPNGGEHATGTTVPRAATTTVPAPTTTAPLRAITAAAPLHVYVGGDSASQPLGETLGTVGQNSGLMQVDLDFQLGTGLARPDVFNWPNHLAEIAVASSPEAIVFFAGGNDYQDLSSPTPPYTRVASRDSEGWYEEYRRRVAGTMDLLGPGRTVFWVGQPIMRDGGMDGALHLVNTIATEEAAKRPWVTFIDARPLFADANGHYNAFLTLPDGSVLECRSGDGVHLTRSCSDRLADAVLAAIDDTWSMDAHR